MIATFATARAAALLAAAALALPTPAAAQEPTCTVNGVTYTRSNPRGLNVISSPSGTKLEDGKVYQHWVGTPGNDLIIGSDGPDYIEGLAGDDVLCGKFNDDRVFGGAGNDAVTGGPALDYCYGGTGTNAFAACEVFPAGMG